MGKPGHRSLPIIDLFAGVGGLSLGASRAGFEVALAVEKDPHAYSAHCLNFPKARHLDTDISTLDGRKLLEAANLKNGELAGLIGGPPCQGFSSMGYQKKDDARNLLFQKFFQLVSETKPWFFLAENVPGILSDQFTSMRCDALAQVSGYTVLPAIKVTASDYGAPTQRTRVIFVGYLSDRINAIAPADLSPNQAIKKITVEEALRGLPTEIEDSWLTEKDSWRKANIHNGSPFWDRVSGKIPAGVGDPTSIKMLRDEKKVSGCIATLHTEIVRNRFAVIPPGSVDAVSRSPRLRQEGYCPTLRAGTASDRGSYQAVRPIHPTEHRVITPREAARLQGFPDWFQFAPTKWHSFRQIGNSVSPLLAESLLSTILGKIKTIAEDV